MQVGRSLIKTVTLLVWVVCVPSVGFAQTKSETLADIRQELVFLNYEIQNLNRELSTTSGGISPSGVGPMLERVNALEQELRRITGVVEKLQFRVDQVVKDGTNRIGDLEFRLVELEGGDVTKLGKTSSLGGGDLPGGTLNTPAKDNPGLELAASEQSDFDRAKAAVESGDYNGGLAQFDQYLLAYPDGPLVGQAQYWRAEALAGLGDWSNAARGFLESFSGTPKGVKAPKALYRLGVSLAELGQTEDACSTLGEVGIRYSSAPEAADAAAKMTSLNCS